MNWFSNCCGICSRNGCRSRDIAFSNNSSYWLRNCWSFNINNLFFWNIYYFFSWNIYFFNFWNCNCYWFWFNHSLSHRLSYSNRNRWWRGIHWSSINIRSIYRINSSYFCSCLIFSKCRSSCSWFWYWGCTKSWGW